MAAGGLFYQTVRFQHPRADGSGAPDKLNWDYSVDGSAEFKPEVMFDDGHSIWMRMPAKAQRWPVRMYKDHGDRVVGHFIRRARRTSEKIRALSLAEKQQFAAEYMTQGGKGNTYQHDIGTFKNALERTAYTAWLRAKIAAD